MPRKAAAGKAVKERAAVEELSFEDAFHELEEIVGQLEGLEASGLALEESLALYERGQRLAARCNTQLDAAELRVQQLEKGELAPLDLREGDRSA